MADPKQYNYKQIDVPYTDKNNGSIVINPEEVNHDTPLDLLGNSVVNWGEKYNKNILHLLENFASPVEPATPVEGMIWFNNKSKELNIYTSNNGWTKSSRLFVDTDEINQPLVGDIKITNDDIYIYNTNKIFVRLLTSKDETIVVYTQNDYNMKIQDDIVICSNNERLINVILNSTVTKKVSILSGESFGINIPNDIVIYGNKINDFVIPPKSEAIILCNAINNTFILTSIHKIDSISDSVQSFKGNQTNAKIRNGEINVEIGDYDTDLITDGRLTIGYEDICPPISKRFTTNTLVVGPNKVTINQVATEDIGMISDNIIPTTGWIDRFVNGQSYGFITKEMLNDGTLLADFSEAKVKGFDILTSASMNGYVKEIDLTNNTFKLEVKSLLVDGSNVVNESTLNNYANITSLGNNVYNGSFKSLKINNKGVAILDSPQFTGNPKAVTVNYLINDDTIATTKFVHELTTVSMNGYVKEIDLTNNTFKLEVKSLLVNGSNVVNESTLNNYANITSLGNNVYNGSFKSLKINNKDVAILDSPQFTGNPKAVTVNYLINDDTIATTKFVHNITDNLSGGIETVFINADTTISVRNYDPSSPKYVAGKVLCFKNVTDKVINIKCDGLVIDGSMGSIRMTRKMSIQLASYYAPAVGYSWYLI